MYFYQIGFCSHENCSISLLHEKKYSKKEFNDLLIEATVELLLNKRNKYHMLDFWDEGEIDDIDICLKIIKENPIYLTEELDVKTKEDYIKKYGNRYWSNFKDIFDYVIDIIIEKYGFKKIKYTQSIWVDDWGEIVKNERSFGENDLILNKVREEYWKRKE